MNTSSYFTEEGVHGEGVPWGVFVWVPNFRVVLIIPKPAAVAHYDTMPGINDKGV